MTGLVRVVAGDEWNSHAGLCRSFGDLPADSPLPGEDLPATHRIRHSPRYVWSIRPGTNPSKPIGSEQHQECHILSQRLLHCGTRQKLGGDDANDQVLIDAPAHIGR